MSTLREIWNNVKSIGYNVRISNKNGLNEWQPLKYKYSIYMLPEGKKMEVNNVIRQLARSRYIVDIANIANIADSNNVQVNSNVNSKVNSKFVIDSITLDNTIDFHHFFIQHFRIPIMNDFKLSILKFAQIAYNAGQYEAAKQQNLYDTIVNMFYIDHKLGDPETYVSGDWLEYFVIDGSKAQRMIFSYSYDNRDNQDNQDQTKFNYFNKTSAAAVDNKKSNPNYKNYVKYKSKYLALKKYLQKNKHR